MLGPIVDPVASSKADFSAINDQFSEAKETFQKRDYSSFCSYFSTEGIDAVTAGLVLSGNVIRFFTRQALARETDAEAELARRHITEITAIFKRHGYEDGNPPEIKLTPNRAANDAAVMKYIEPVKNRIQFVCEMLEVLVSMHEGVIPKSLAVDSELIRLSVDGNLAVGNIQTGNGEVLQRAITCVREDNRWKIQELNMLGAGL